MKQYRILFPEKFSDYQLIDSGDGRKLERFGPYTLIRPEPQAIWPAQLGMEEWNDVAHARYDSLDSHKGKWVRLKDMKMPWRIKYKGPNYTLFFELKFTQFKHLGIFPEQASHWDFIWEKTNQLRNPKVLNLFAYTGGASLAAKAAGADVIHLDSVKPVVSWARNNQDISGLNDIRWLVEDALKFVQREVKRGHKYNGIIMDPPAYGLGPKGERWKLEDKLNELVEGTTQLLHKTNSFMVFNTYSLNLSAFVLKTMVEAHLGQVNDYEVGELGVKSGQAQILPLGSFYRFVR